MLKVEHLEFFNVEAAIRGMRNPMNSWDRSDSSCSSCLEQEPKRDCESCQVYIGKNDLELMRRLYRGGSEHRKYLRHIFVSCDITAPLYWWKEMDTYKFVSPDPLHYDSNSCSTMHKISAKAFELDDFSHEHLVDDEIVVTWDDQHYEDTPNDCLYDVVGLLNAVRDKYVETKDKKYWWQLIQLLPESYNQKRTVSMTYETVVDIIRQRSGHKLDEWHTLVDALKTLPYINEIMSEESHNAE